MGMQLQTVDAELSKLEVATRRSQTKLDRMTMELEMYWVRSQQFASAQESTASN